MALQVWLPLMGDLHNQGLDPGYFPNPTTAWASNGKLSNKSIYSNAQQTATFNNLNNCTNFSITWWVKIDAAVEIQAWYHIFDLSCIVGSTTTTIRDEFTNEKGGHQIILGKDTTVGSTNYSYHDPNINKTQASNVWVHYAIVKNDINTFIYTNGALTQTVINSVFENSSSPTRLTGELHLCHTTVTAGQLQDLRVYDNCLTPEEIKKIAQGLILHYPLNRNGITSDNLLKNGFGELGNENWSNNNVVSTENLPNFVPEVHASFRYGESVEYIPIQRNHTYRFSMWVKAANDSGYSYPSIKPYDIDKNFIANYNCPDGFRSATLTTLTQPLQDGDTQIHVASLSSWATGSGHYGNYAAIFGYTDGSGYTWPDLKYTRTVLAFSSGTNEKTNLDTTNNIITLNSAYHGNTIPSGTSICQSYDGSTYYYPVGAVNNATTTNWTFKKGEFSSEANRLSAAAYIRYLAYPTCYSAGIKIIDTSLQNIVEADIEYDVSGFENNGQRIKSILTYASPNLFDGLVVYNNFSSSGTTGTLTKLSETFCGAPVYRLTMTPNESSLSSFQQVLHSHGVYNTGQTLNGSTKYTYQIFYRPVTHFDIRVGGVASNVNGWTELPPRSVGDGWFLVGQYRDGTVTENKTDGIFTSFYTPSAVAGTAISIDFACPRLFTGITTLIPKDTLECSTDTPKYKVSTKFNSAFSKIKLPAMTFSNITNSYTFAWWQYNVSTGNMPWGFSDGNRLNCYHCTPLCWNTGNGATNQFKNGENTVSPTSLQNNWHHMVVTGDGTSNKLYIDGVYRGTAISYVPLTGTQIWISGWSSGTDYSFTDSKESDFRIYATTLSAEDVLDLYEDTSPIYTPLPTSPNLWAAANQGIVNKTFTGGLASYTQSNCQVTLTDDGYRIYRPPNLNTTNNGNTMWGGFIFRQYTPLLLKGHTYMIKMDIKGQTSNGSEAFWSNQAGWSGGAYGLSTEYTWIENGNLPAEWSSSDYVTRTWRFTVTGNTYKECTGTYSSFYAGIVYPVFRDFKFGFNYGNTGALGTDLYIKNIRLYDITYETDLSKFQ